MTDAAQKVYIIVCTDFDRYSSIFGVYKTKEEADTAMTIFFPRPTRRNPTPLRFEEVEIEEWAFGESQTHLLPEAYDRRRECQIPEPVKKERNGGTNK